MKNLLIFLLILASIPSVVLAKLGEGKLEVGAFLGEEFFSNASQADNDFVVGIRAGWRFGQRYEVELVYDFIDTNEKIFHGIIEEVESLSVNFLWNYWSSKNGRARPYISAGVGDIDVTIDTTALTSAELDLLTKGWVTKLPKVMTMTPRGSFNDNDTLISVGAGMRVFLKPNTAFRYELRAKEYEVFEISTTDLELTVGFTVTFLGGKN